MSAIVTKSAGVVVKKSVQVSGPKIVGTVSEVVSQLGSTPVKFPSMPVTLPDLVSQLALQNPKLPKLLDLSAVDLSAVDFSAIPTLTGVVPGTPALGILPESTHAVKLTDLDAGLKFPELKPTFQDFLQDFKPEGYVCAPGTKPGCIACPVNAVTELSNSGLDLPDIFNF